VFFGCVKVGLRGACGSVTSMLFSSYRLLLGVMNFMVEVGCGLGFVILNAWMVQFRAIYSVMTQHFAVGTKGWNFLILNRDR